MQAAQLALRYTNGKRGEQQPPQRDRQAHRRSKSGDRTRSDKPDPAAAGTIRRDTPSRIQTIRLRIRVPVSERTRCAPRGIGIQAAGPWKRRTRETRIAWNTNARF